MSISKIKTTDKDIEDMAILILDNMSYYEDGSIKPATTSKYVRECLVAFKTKIVNETIRERVPTVNKK